MAVVRGGCAAISATSPRSDAGATNANANTSPGNEYARANPHSYARAGNLAGRLPLGQHLHRAAMPVHLRLPGGKAGPPEAPLYDSDRWFQEERLCTTEEAASGYCRRR